MKSEFPTISILKKSSSQLYRHKEKSPIHQFSQKFLLIEKRKEIFTFSEEKTVSSLTSEELLNLTDEGKDSVSQTFLTFWVAILR